MRIAGYSLLLLSLGVLTFGALAIDAVEFRRRNILRDGRPQATGTIVESAAIEEVLERVALRMNWAKPFDRGSGPVRRDDDPVPARPHLRPDG